MKKFISKNWKNILMVIGGIFLVIDLFFIITVPATIPQDFKEYGPNVESDVFDGASNITEEIGNVGVSGESAGLVTDVSESTGLSPTIAKALLVFGFLFIIILVISSVVDNPGGGDKKKK